ALPRRSPAGTDLEDALAPLQRERVDRAGDDVRPRDRLLSTDGKRSIVLAASSSGMKASRGTEANAASSTGRVGRRAIVAARILIPSCGWTSEIGMSSAIVRTAGRSYRRRSIAPTR